MAATWDNGARALLRKLFQARRLRSEIEQIIERRRSNGRRSLMASVFTVRERILLEMLDQGVGVWVDAPYNMQSHQVLIGEHQLDLPRDGRGRDTAEKVRQDR